MDQDEIHHKMCKKVAQLTKVIFHLNTRNDEADQHLAAVTDAYEKEIELILRDANAKVRKIAEESAQNEHLSRQVEALRVSYDNEKRAAQKELQNVRSVLDSRETKNLALWSDRVNKFNLEVQTLRQQATQQAAQFKAGLQQAESNFFQRTEELTSRHQGEIARLDREHDEQLQHQARERDLAEAELQKASKRDLEEERRRTAEEVERCRGLEEQLALARRQMEEGISEGSDALRQAHQRNDELAQELQQLRAELERAHEASAKDAVLLRTREEEIGALKAAAEQAEHRRKALLDEADALRRQSQETSNQLDALRLQHEELQRSHAQNQSTSEASAAEERLQLQEQIRELRDIEKTLRGELADSEAAQARLREAETRAQERIGCLEAEVAKLNKDSIMATSAREEAARQAAADLRELESQLEAQRAEVRRLEAQLAEQAAEMRRRLEETGDAGNKLLDSERAAHSEALATLRKECEGQLSELRMKHERQLSELRKCHDADLEQIKAKLAQAESAREQDGNSSAKALEERERELRKREQELRDLSNELSSLNGQLKEAQQKSVQDLSRQRELETELQQARSEARKEIDRLQAEHAKELTKLRSQFEGNTAQISEKHRHELEALRKELQAKISAQEQDLQRAQQEHETEVRELKRQISELGENSDAARLSASAQLEQLKAKMQQEVEQVRTEGVEMVQRLSRQHQDQLIDMTAKQNVALDQLREKLSKTHQDRVDEMREKRKVEIEEQKQNHAKQVEELTAKHETFRQQIQHQHEAAVRKLEEAAENAAKKHADEIRSANEALHHAQGLLEQSREECENLGSGLRRAEEQLQRLRAEMEAAEEGHRREIQKQEDSFNREKRGLKEQHKGALERLLEEQIRETQALQEQFDRARRLQESQVEVLLHRVAELQELYDSRPSREEDLARIAELEVEVTEQARAIEKLVEDMKFYKLELVNREHNYNKVFGAAPTVGVMNPVAAKKRSESGAPPPMRLVQQPGGDLGLPPLGPGGMALPAGPGGQRASAKRVSTRNLR